MTRLDAHPLVAALPAEARQAAFDGCELRRIEHGVRLIKDGDEALQIFLLLSGAVRIYFERPDGAEITAKIIAAPSFFGEAEAMCGLRFMENVTALGPVEVMVMPIARFEELLARHAGFGHAVVRDLSALFAVAIYHEKSLAFDPVTVRLANFLLDHLEWSEADRFGAPRVALTQDEMAADSRCPTPIIPPASVATSVASLSSASVLSSHGACTSTEKTGRASRTSKSPLATR